MSDPAPTGQPPHSAPPVHRLVPFVYVGDVDASIAFYALLGFRALQVNRDHDGTANWAWCETHDITLGRGPAQIMLSRSGRPITPDHQDIFFYMHCADIVALRNSLLARGLVDAGEFKARSSPHDRRGIVFTITHPAHMREGEFRIHDPDGYAILVGQCDWVSTRTPPGAR